MDVLAPVQWLPRRSAPLLGRSAQSSGPVGDLRLIHLTAWCAWCSCFAPDCKPRWGEAAGILELLRELQDLLMQLQLGGYGLVRGEVEGWYVCQLFTSASL